MLGAPNTSWPDSFRPSTRLPNAQRSWLREMPGTSPGMTAWGRGSVGETVHRLDHMRMNLGYMSLVGEHPEVLAAAALARVYDERAFDERDPAEGAWDEARLVPAQHEGAKVDMAGRRAGRREAG